MNEQSLKTYLTSNLEISEAEIASLVDSCARKTFAKGELLLRPGSHCQHTFFVERGLLRQYSIDQRGKEHILMFAPEGWFVSDRESVYFQQPSPYYIEALENTTAALITDEFLQTLEEKVPGFRDFNHRLLHNHIRHLQSRINLLLSARAEDRYISFIKMYPDVLLRVPQTMVASYLGITPESLSRVRRDLARSRS